MKLWVDDIRQAPEDYLWCKSVNEAIELIKFCERLQKYTFDRKILEFIDIDHDAGDYANDGGDYIKLLDWLEETGRNYPIRIHSMSVIGRMNMEAICRRNGWTIVR